MSIWDDMMAVKAMADEILRFVGPPKKYAPYGRCECGTELEYEPPFHGAHDQPPSEGGYWCSECQKWEAP